MIKSSLSVSNKCKRIICVCSFLLIFSLPQVQGKRAAKIYHKGWIDFNKNGKKDLYEDPNQPIEKRIKDLISQMTLEEKTCQMATLYGSGRVLRDSLPTPAWKNEVWKDGIGNIDEQHNGLGRFRSLFSYPYGKSVEARHQIQRFFVEETRLGIPVDYTNEGIRGLCHDRATFFPAQCGQGATWNKQLIAAIGEVEAKEAKVLGYTNIYSPILDIAQDPRWGRTVETYGEDPYHVSQLGMQQIQAIQSQGLVSTPKHFAVYSIPVGGRDGNTRTDPHVAYREMRTLYLEPFRKAFQEAGALGVMSSYNDYDGVPVSGSRFFLTDILRDEWGFKGYVVSDSEAVEFIETKHGVAKTYVDAVAMAVNAGLNVRTHFTPPEDFILPLRQAVEEGKVSMEILDQRVEEILYVKFVLGLFDNPYVGSAVEAEKVVAQKAHKEVALQAALESMVLLKNDSSMLPLSKSIRSLAIIGPNAAEKRLLLSRYGPANAPLITVEEGLRELLPDCEIRYEKGCDIVDPHYPESELLDFPYNDEEQAMMDRAIEAAKAADVVILACGGNNRTVGESFSRTDLNLPGRQNDLIAAVCETGKPVVLVLLDGRAATINYANKYVPAILHAWFPGEFGGRAIAETLFGDYNPGGRLSVTFPKSVGQVPYAFPFKPGSEAEEKNNVYGALYPFGHGLSYTTFGYKNLHVTTNKASKEEKVMVTCEITNQGAIKGDEVVQLYLHKRHGSVISYTQVLRGFERITLEAGETKSVTFTLSDDDLAIWNDQMQFVVEPGLYEIRIGASSKDIRLKEEVSIEV